MGRCRNQVSYGLVEELDEFGGHLDGGGEVVGKLYEEVSLAQAFEFEEASFMAVKGTADDADVFAVHVGGDLSGGVVARWLGGRDGCYEALHGALVYCHWCLKGGSAQPTVLKCGYGLYQWIELTAKGAYEEKIGYDGHLSTLFAGRGGLDYGLEWGEYGLPGTEQ